MRDFSKKRRNDLILIVAVAAVATVSLLLHYLYGQVGQEIQVTCGGMVVGRYSLARDQTIRLETPEGGYNILVIQDGRADVTEASCPDKICVDQRAVSRGGESITCLPNKTVITVIGDSDVDVVS